MIDVILSDLTSTSSTPHNPVLDDFISTGFTAAIAEEVYWRWEDTPTMYPQFLGRQSAGFTLAVPFDLQGRDVRLFFVGVAADGRRSVQDVREATQVVFPAPPPSGVTESDEVLAGVALASGNVVNIYNDSGTSKARLADADDPAKEAHAFVAYGDGGDPVSYSIGDPVRLFYGGNILAGLTSLTPGNPCYLSSTAGAVTQTAPTASGKIVQEIGTALNATEMIFEPQETIEIT